MTENEFAVLINEAGGKLYLVGGWVRDKIRGVAPKDKDYMIAGLSEEKLQELLPEAIKVGKSFPVFRAEVEDEFCEIALARRERKTGQGHRGFKVEYDPSVTVEEDLYRRDTTMNSLAWELPAGRLVDPYGGEKDIRHRTIRAVSEHFREDPVRALRAARQAAEFEFEIAAETYAMMEALGPELTREPTERIIGELHKCLAAKRPSLFFRALQKAHLLKLIFPEIAALQGKTQPLAFHPEGDAFEHTMKIVDETAAGTNNIAARFAGLAHDLGKGLTPPEMLPHHYGHEKRGLTVLREWNKRMTLPNEWLKAAAFVIEQHMRAPRLEKPGKICDLLMTIPKTGLPVQDLLVIIKADHHGLPPYLEEAEALISELQKVRGNEAPPELKGPAVGEWLRRERIRLLAKKVDR